ncbi:MAG: hypothetical protein R3F46_03930 [bacterium]
MQGNFFHRTQIFILLAFMVGMFAGSVVQPTRAMAGWDLGDLIKDGAKGAIVGGGIAYLVKKNGKEIDKTINKLYKDNNFPIGAATRVVPIVDALGTKHVGAAQIVGPQSAVDEVSSVVLLETSFLDKVFRINGYVPVKGNVDDLKRVAGVGVSAVIDVKVAP